MKKNLLTPAVALTILMAGAQTPAEQPAVPQEMVSQETVAGARFSTRGADGLYRPVPAESSARTDTQTDSLTLTLTWSLRANAPGNITDAAGYLAVIRSDGEYALIPEATMKNAPDNTLALRLPAGEYVAIAKFTTNRPEYAAGGTYVAREHLQLHADTTISFNPEEATRHIGFQYTMHDGTPVKLPLRITSSNYDREGANSYKMIIVRSLVHTYNSNMEVTTQFIADENSATSGTNRERSGDIYVNPGMSEDFTVRNFALWNTLHPTDNKQDYTRPAYFAAFPETRIPASDTTYTCSDWKLQTLPAPVAHTPAPQANTTYKYSYQILARGFNTALKRYSNAENCSTYVAMPAAETPLMRVSFGTVESNSKPMMSAASGYGIQLPPLNRRHDGLLEYSICENVGDGWPYALMENGVIDFSRHERFTYPVEGQNPEFGNTAPILSLPWLTQMPTATGYYGTAPHALSMCPTYIGNGGERRDIDKNLIMIHIMADNDTVWSKKYTNFVTQGASHFKEPHETPHRIRYMFRNSNVMVDSIAGFSNTDLEFTENSADAMPPTLQMMQMRDAQGKVTVKFDRLADATIMLAGGDFHYDWNASHFVCGPVTLKVEAARRGSTNFTELTATEDVSAFHMPVFGHFWTVRPSEKPLASRDGWFDLRITMTDAAGNTNVQHISPAFYASDAAGAALVGDDAALTLSGSVLCAEGMEISVYNVAGAPVGRAAGTFDTATLPAGVYIATAGGKTLKFIR